MTCSSWYQCLSYMECAMAKEQQLQICISGSQIPYHSNPLGFTDHFAIGIELLGWDLDCNSSNTCRLPTGLNQLHTRSTNSKDQRRRKHTCRMRSIRWIWMYCSKDHYQIRWRASTRYWIKLTTRTPSVKYSTSASCILISFKPLTLLCNAINTLEIYSSLQQYDLFTPCDRSHPHTCHPS